MCQNPELPVFDGSLVPSTGPAKCINCGHVVYFVCGPDSPAPTIERVPELNKRVYPPRPCARCFRTFQPTGGRSLYCDRTDCLTYTSGVKREHDSHRTA